MNRNEFLKELREALKNNLSEAEVQENIRYYTGYIEDEVKKGRSEKEVVAELGDPWLIAKTIVTTPGQNSSYQSYDSDQDGYVHVSGEQEEKSSRIHKFQLNSKWKILLFILAIVAVLFLVISIVSGIISMLMPILGPIILIVLVVKIFSNKKR